MAAIHRRSQISPISALAELAAADDLNGVQDLTKSFDVTGASRVIVIQENNGTAGTAGVDLLAISHDGGLTWAAADKVLAASSDDSTGTELDGVLNAAGVEPVAVAIFKCGPYEGPTAIRITRDTAGDLLTGGADWVTGAPSVDVFTIGQTSGTLTALA
jgi:hypothetical protein